jgi:hypothetical protein
VTLRITELDKKVSDGAPAGVKEAAEDGGGPAGVVEGSFPKSEFPPPLEFLFGVRGAGLDPAGLESIANLCAIVITCDDRSGDQRNGGLLVEEAALPRGIGATRSCLVSFGRTS